MEVKRLITLDQWNAALFNSRYSRNTLRAWARNGCINPPAEKVGRDWLVEQDAQYRKPKKPVEIPDNVDMSIVPVDPVVLAILNNR